MSECKHTRQYDRFVQEWANRFGFMATENEPDSFKSIDEVACILSESQQASARHVDYLEATLKQTRPHIVKSGNSSLLEQIDSLLRP
jgi:hypothetical protein